MEKNLWKHTQSVKQQSPLVHNITNYVVMNNTANALLAVGASPIMAHAKAEVADMVGIAHALVINISVVPDKMEATAAAMAIPLIINDHAGITVKVNAAGIHVGNNDIQPGQLRMQAEFRHKVIGYSIEYLSQLENEQVEIADYLGISPVFKTNTKTDTVTEWGLAGITKIRRLTKKPLVAIGHIDQNNAKAVISAGANCIAVVSAICVAKNPQRAANDLKNEILS
ncbi:thiamine-phosphate diphosphorylase [Pedobacter sp. UYP24]